MKHWEKYIQKHQAYNKYAIPAGFDYGMVVVIPCFDEPDVLTTLRSLMQCVATQYPVGVLVVVNSSELTDVAIVKHNRVTYDEVVAFTKENNQPQLAFHALLCENMPRKHAGVGLARKIGMEWAVRGFLQSTNSNGVIISLDADCTVSDNYLQLIEHQFTTYSPNCCVLNFKHRTNDNNSALQNAIDQYEAYIWYFRNALKAIDFPFYYHTIGSAFAVLADAYVRVGGIGRLQGGEDFYFLQ
ncbi:MAG: glycosyltransferase family 2 protein [Bacteroidales bacterium]|nr:glycosyltransferase family 2 protein [Bacteroidales bacterium]